MIFYKGTEEQVKKQLNCAHQRQGPYSDGIGGEKYECILCHCEDRNNTILPQDLVHQTVTIPDCKNCKKLEEVLEEAYYDELTQLPNRILFKDRLKRMIVDSSRYNRSFALMFIDLDTFKPVNDKLGHHVGDLLLQKVAERLSECLRDSDSITRNIVARMGGDEFTILINGLKGYEDAAVVAERIQTELAKPFYLEKHGVKTSASIGIALYPSHGDTMDSLLVNADLAMYQTKRSGGNSYLFYNSSMKPKIIPKIIDTTGPEDAKKVEDLLENP